jgi:hypothetical protein
MRLQPQQQHVQQLLLRAVLRAQQQIWQQLRDAPSLPEPQLGRALQLPSQQPHALRSLSPLLRRVEQPQRAQQLL